MGRRRRAALVLLPPGRGERSRHGVGYALASEDWPPPDLVRLAREAEATGFELALVSDHFHPWNDAQGQSTFVWTVLGAIARETERLPRRDGRRVPAGPDPPRDGRPRRRHGHRADARPLRARARHGREPERARPRRPLAVLGRAAGDARGGDRGHAPCSGRAASRPTGDGTTPSRTRASTRSPQSHPPIVVAAANPGAAELAGRTADGLANVAPAPEVVERFEAAGGAGKPRYGILPVCVAPTEEEGLETAHRLWPNLALQGEAFRELARPRDFEGASATVPPEDLAASVPCGPDPEAHVRAIEEFARAGYDHVWVQQIGPDQNAFFRLYEEDFIPADGRRGPLVVTAIPRSG